VFEIVHETDIRASAETIFGILHDMARYPEWNPWHERGEGRLAAGEVVRFTARVGRRALVVDHRILDVTPAEMLRWCDLGWFTRLAYGETTHRLERRGDHVRHRVQLRITGPLAWLVRRTVGRGIARGIAAEVDALKARAEARS
jgi:uncharacterized protein YndB with AHSA1/START domain